MLYKTFGITLRVMYIYVIGLVLKLVDRKHENVIQSYSKTINRLSFFLISN